MKTETKNKINFLWEKLYENLKIYRETKYITNILIEKIFFWIFYFLS